MDSIYPYEKPVFISELSDSQLREVLELVLEHLDVKVVIDATPDYTSLRLAKYY